MFKLSLKLVRATHNCIVLAQRGLRTYTRYVYYSLRDRKGRQNGPYLSHGADDVEERYSLNHTSYEDFLLSQWSNSAYHYAVYRTLVAVYFTFMVFYAAVYGILGWKMLIMLTYWSFFILTACQILRAANCWHHIQLKKEGKDPKVILQNSRRIKFQWLLHNLSCNAAPVVAILFWTLAYDGSGVNLINLTTHGVNAIFVILDTFITRTPVRLIHLYHCTLYGLLYGIFSAVYWKFGGTNHKNEPFIYKVLDFSLSVKVAISYIFAVAFIVAPMIHCMFFFLYRFRLFIHRYLKVTERRGKKYTSTHEIQKEETQ
ncbi:hypothetical protein CHS0354_002790 [Potamilus streckersoni]|uniref:Protein rolling stone n=1 Tax=Potamilus streckersoni TaxID=2493646 RepID=A0AAE0VZ50_9BIVA|nr:hypothetical protein CHS0354_002790 [Potamilus streckersoni]